MCVRLFGVRRLLGVVVVGKLDVRRVFGQLP